MSASFAYRQSVLDLANAQKAAADLKGKDKEANLRLEESMVAVADATVAMRVEQAAANGVTLSTAQQNDIWIAKLRDLEKKLDKNSPLRKNIDAYIAQLQSIPSSVTTTIAAQAAGYSSPKRRLAAGGSVAPGETVVAGESGAELVTGGANGATVTPMGKGAGNSVHLHIHGGVFMDHGPTIDALSNALLRHARFRPGT
jgi:hypothetical protein